ncbi:MAG TPA: ATP-binding cassette domain-containing protein, partial [Erysipelotrichaceae bacterium]|nr:ATP-binding cassette domain-containing protein [Erysipelotrichaceae bacterium]
MRVENLSYAYGSNVILDNINFNVLDGEMLGIVGESGCGKSVTALSIMGLLGRELGIL